jgi:hypothetical protein
LKGKLKVKIKGATTAGNVAGTFLADFIDLTNGETGIKVQYK